MMPNVNIMMNQYPFYMVNPNLITPIFTINNNIIYNYVVNIINTISTIINSIINISTYLFNDIITTSTKQLINIYYSAFGNNHDLAFILLVASAFIFITFYDKFVSYFLYHKPLFEKITRLEQEIQWLKKNDRMRENDTENLLKQSGTIAEQNVHQIYNISEQLKIIQKQMKKIDKEVKMYN
jgi:amino acid permease